MATSVNDNRVRSAAALLGNDSGRPLDAGVNSGDINSGDYCYWTGSGVASFGSSLTFDAALVAKLAKALGVSRDTNPLTSGGIANPISTVGVDAGGEFAFNTTSGDSYHWDDEVTLGTDAQTIQLVSNLLAAAPTCALSTTAAGTNPFANEQHTVAIAWLTSMGWTVAGAVTSGATTTTSGTDPSITVTVPTLPAYALAAGIVVDGILSDVVNAAGNVTVSGYGANMQAAPAESAIAIGRVRLDNQSASTTSVSGGTGITVNVALKQIYPHNSLQ